jgi:hypothetical protein
MNGVPDDQKERAMPDHIRQLMEGQVIPDGAFLAHVCGKQGFQRGRDGLNDECPACVSPAASPSVQPETAEITSGGRPSDAELLNGAMRNAETLLGAISDPRLACSAMALIEQLKRLGASAPADAPTRDPMNYPEWFRKIGVDLGLVADEDEWPKVERKLYEIADVLWPDGFDYGTVTQSSGQHNNSESKNG